MGIQSCWKGKGFVAVLLLAMLGGAARHTSAQASNDLHKQFLLKFSAAALERTNHVVRYDGAYVRIPYPGGDVPAGTGVCTDEVVRAYRAVGIDLQQKVHEDMVASPTAYPRRWGRGPMSAGTDTNIDHRRVPNLMVFFGRHGQSLALSAIAGDYHPGDLVAWNLGGGITHIGIVVDQK